VLILGVHFLQIVGFEGLDSSFDFAGLADSIPGLVDSNFDFAGLADSIPGLAGSSFSLVAALVALVVLEKGLRWLGNFAVQSTPGFFQNFDLDRTFAVPGPPTLEAHLLVQDQSFGEPKENS